MKIQYALTIILCLGLFGCDRANEEKPTKPERISDLVPLKVVMSDFATFGKGGDKLLYRIRASALITIPLNEAKIDDSNLPKVKVSNIPLPMVDSHSIKFEEVCLIDARRSIFTSREKFGKMHDNLKSEAAKRFHKCANDKFIIQEAKRRADKCIRGFYQEFKCDADIEWRKE